jgi:hypothetical protein
MRGYVSVNFPRESCLPVEKPRILSSSEPAIRAAADPLGL